IAAPNLGAKPTGSIIEVEVILTVAFECARREDVTVAEQSKLGVLLYARNADVRTRRGAADEGAAHMHDLAVDPEIEVDDRTTGHRDASTVEALEDRLLGVVFRVDRRQGHVTGKAALL